MIVEHAVPRHPKATSGITLIVHMMHVCIALRSAYPVECQGLQVAASRAYSTCRLTYMVGTEKGLRRVQSKSSVAFYPPHYINMTTCYATCFEPKYFELDVQCVCKLLPRCASREQTQQLSQLTTVKYVAALCSEHSALAHTCNLD